MTSDAKIGLLLGLVVIFIIAFVINGLPRFQPGLDSNEPALDKIVQDNPIGARERNAPGVIETSSGGSENNHAPAEGAVAEDIHFSTPSWSDEHSIGEADRSEGAGISSGFDEQVVEKTSDWPPQPVEPQVASDTRSQEEIRDQRDFPFNPTTDEPQLPTLANDNQGQRGTLPANPDFRRGGLVPPVGQVQTAQQTQSNPPAQASQAAWPKTYVVKEGDNNLAKIAKKFYGEQEGNRFVNINKIFDANKKELKSPDKIFVGQTITIPQPASPVTPQPASVLNGSMFQQVSSVGGSSTIRQETVTAIKDTGRWYEVKEDDYLWKIAADQLGKGTRYEEINKLNADILKNGTKLKPGMKLRLPAQ